MLRDILTDEIKAAGKDAINGLKRIINAVTYWIAPQAGVIAALERKIKAQEDLILTIRANRQTIINENEKLWAELNKRLNKRR